MHGACVQDGSWWWHRTAELLQAQDMTSVAPALPSCGETGTPGGAGGPGLTEDVAAVRGVLTSSDESTVIVAHSYGGIVVAEAAAGVNAVRHLVLVSSYLPEVGQSLSEFGDSDGDGAPARSSTSTWRQARSASVPNCSWRRSCRTATVTSRRRRRRGWLGRACRSRPSP